MTLLVTGLSLLGTFAHSGTTTYKYDEQGRTLLQTCKMNDVDSQAWLTQTLKRIANRWPSSDIETLMPWNYKP